MTKAIPDAVLTAHTAVLGMTGSGKTSTEKLIVEQVVAEGFRVCVLDTLKSDWWGITSSADGKRPGLPFRILGGPRGHVPLHAGAGKAIGQLVGTGKLPLSIIDMADFEAGGIQRFFVDFAQSLWRSVRGVIYLVIEEAHEVAPKERAGFGAENMAIHWAKKLATGSRTKGIRLIVATQSVQQLHNRVLGSCQTLIAHQLMFDADQEPVIKWIKGVNKTVAPQVTETIGTLPTGVGWLCAGRAKIFEKRHFPKFGTFDNTATPEGDAAEIDIKTAPVDQAELSAIIGDAIKDAEADDPKALKQQLADRDKKITSLEAELRTKTAQAVPDLDAIAEAKAAGVRRGYDQGVRDSASWHAPDLTRIGDLVKALHGTIAGVDQAVTAVSEQIDNEISALNRQWSQGHPSTAPLPETLKQIIESGSPAPASAPRRDSPVRAATPVQPALQRQSSPAASNGDGTLTGPQQRMLDVVAFWHSVGYHAPTREQVAAVCGYSIRASTFRVVAGALKTAGYIDYPDNGKIMLTPRGHEIARPLAADESRRKLESVLSGAQLRIVNILRAAGGKLKRSDLIAQAGYSEQASTHRVVIGGLKTLEVVDYPERGVVELSRWAAEVLQA